MSIQLWGRFGVCKAVNPEQRRENHPAAIARHALMIFSVRGEGATYKEALDDLDAQAAAAADGYLASSVSSLVVKPELSYVCELLEFGPQRS